MTSENQGDNDSLQSNENPVQPSSPGAEEVVQRLLQALSAPIRDQITSDALGNVLASAVHLQATVGWLPPPQMLREYEEIYPGFTDELLAMTKQQETHRQHLEKVTVEGNNRRANQGLWIGAAVTACFLGVSIVLGLNHNEVAASVIGGVDIVGLVTVFVVGRREQRLERREKAKLTSQVRRT